MLLAIDPGNKESGVVLVRESDLKPIIAKKVTNEEILNDILTGVYNCCMFYDDCKEALNHVAIEMIASYGMPVGAEVFDTCVWIGRFIQALQDNNYNLQIKYIYRKDEKINLCGSMKAKDSNITQALIDRFAPGISNRGKGTKKEPGWFYGFKKDIWSAYAVGITYYDLYLSK